MPHKHSNLGPRQHPQQPREKGRVDIDLVYSRQLKLEEPLNQKLSFV